MSEWGIKRPEEISIELPPGMDWFKFLGEGEKPIRGKSTLKKWCCPECGLKVRIGISENPELMHIPCGSVLIKEDGKTHNVYKAPNGINKMKKITMDI